MKRNYISPLTVNMHLAGDAMMQNSLSIVTGSGAPTVDNGQNID